MKDFEGNPFNFQTYKNSAIYSFKNLRRKAPAARTSLESLVKEESTIDGELRTQLAKKLQVIFSTHELHDGKPEYKALKRIQAQKKLIVDLRGTLAW